MIVIIGLAGNFSLLAVGFAYLAHREHMTLPEFIHGFLNYSKKDILTFIRRGGKDDGIS